MVDKSEDNLVDRRSNSSSGSNCHRHKRSTNSTKWGSSDSSTHISSSFRSSSLTALTPSVPIDIDISASRSDNSLDSITSSTSSSPDTVKGHSLGRNKNNSNRLFFNAVMSNYKSMRNLLAAAMCMMVVRILTSNVSVSTFAKDSHPLARQDAAVSRPDSLPSSIQDRQHRQELPKPAVRGNLLNIKSRDGSSGSSSNNNNNQMMNGKHGLLIDPDDYIYKRNLDHYDAAPIVVAEYKLLFFSVPKVACTTFKFLFRRVKGIEDWSNQDPQKVLPHNPEHNGLSYLWDYSLEEADRMMTSPEWTRAIFVRDPKQRFLSAFLDKAIGNDGWHVLKACCQSALDCKASDQPNRDVVYDLLEVCHEDRWDSRKNVLVPHWNLDVPCCEHVKQCREKAETIEGFLQTIETCHDEHWAPQYDRMEPKYWKYINFVGHLETMKVDTKRLLERIGAWKKWGATGWGPQRNASILDESEYSQSHTTGSNFKIYHWYTPEKERLVEKFYEADYQHPAFQFTIQNLTEPLVPLPDGKLIKRVDKIYSRMDWDGAPIVVERYKLIFFTLPKVGATIWKQAFRRMEGFDDWSDVGGKNGLPHDPNGNGLKYLYDYDIETAEGMMTSPDWTRAVFVRSPKDRFLSVFHQMSRNRDQIDKRCCPYQPGCSSTLRTMARFVDLMGVCYSAHWAPFSERMEGKYWPYINFVGTMENAEEDARKLLSRLGAWEDVGQNGWGDNGDERIFAKDSRVFDTVRDSLAMYTPQVDKMLDEYYKLDYESKYFTFPTHKVWAMEQGIFPDSTDE